MRIYRVVNASELAAAYAAADYGVTLDGDTVRLRVGEPATDLEAYWPASRYVFVTAWNPASEPHSDTINESADALLVSQLDADGVARLRAWAQGPDGHWHEPGWLLADFDDHAADHLAREFGQAGVLCWTRGEPVRLRMLIQRPDPASPSASESPYTDWPGETVPETQCAG